MPDAVRPCPPPQPLRCMEIWDSNQAMENALSVPGIDAWVYSRPHAKAQGGGDIHYVSVCGGGKIARFVVADVAGHGAAVDELAVKLRKLMRRYISTLDQTRFVRTLNREFSALSVGGKFATALLATYFAPTDHLVLCNAGHPPPLWFHSRTAAWEELQPHTPSCVRRLSNLPLGIVEPTDYHQFAVPLDKGDLLLIYTDALVEARNHAGDFLGPRGLLEMVGDISIENPDRFCRRLLDRINAFRGGAPPEDDETLILLHHNAANPARQPLGEMIRVVGKMLRLIKV